MAIGHMNAGELMYLWSCPRKSFIVLCALCLCATGLVAAPAALGRDRVETLLQSLADAPGPSGYEEEVRAIMVRELKPFATQISYDGLGSVIAQHGAKGPRIMLDAHMDELGGIVRRITPDGFLSMQMVGGWLDQALLGQRWVILSSKGTVHAVTGIRDIHVLPPEDRSKVFPRNDIFLDVGAKNAAEVAALGIGPGDAVAPDSPFAVLNGTQRYLGKAWDDRVGCAVVVEVMRRLAAEGHPNILIVAATTQEETGIRGAHTAAEVVHPDIGIAIEGGVAGDVPGAHPEETQARLGGGPGVFLYDFSEQPNRRLISLIKETGQAEKIPFQIDLVSGYGDDSAAIQASNGGVPVVNIVVPVRYTHAHNGVMDRYDFDRTVDFVVALIKRLDSATVKRVRDFAP
jgi:putative aminopeptidase FrvX